MNVRVVVWVGAARVLRRPFTLVSTPYAMCEEVASFRYSFHARTELFKGVVINDYASQFGKVAKEGKSVGRLSHSKAADDLVNAR